MSYTSYTMNVAIKTDKTISIYITAHDRRRKTSKSVTVRGEGITPAKIIELIVNALNVEGGRSNRKAV